MFCFFLKSLYFSAFVFLTGCHSLWKQKSAPSSGYAYLQPSSGAWTQDAEGRNDATLAPVYGKVKLKSLSKSKVLVTAQVSGLKPLKSFGFHVHEFGACGKKGLQAGGHFNPYGARHGGPHSSKKHLGDMGNLKSDKKGLAFYSTELKASIEDFFGRSVLVHAKADDFKTQPSGASGARIACGVIGRIPAALSDKSKKSVKVSAQKAQSPAVKTLTKESGVSEKAAAAAQPGAGGQKAESSSMEAAQKALPGADPSSLKKASVASERDTASTAAGPKAVLPKKAGGEVSKSTAVSEDRSSAKKAALKTAVSPKAVSLKAEKAALPKKPVALKTAVSPKAVSLKAEKAALPKKPAALKTAVSPKAVSLKAEKAALPKKPAALKTAVSPKAPLKAEKAALPKKPAAASNRAKKQ